MRKHLKCAGDLFIIICFFVVLYLPLSIQLGRSVLGNDFALFNTLEGNFDTYEKVDFSMKSYLEGQYQEKFELWWKNSLGGREVIIPLYNQFRYSLFNQGLDAQAITASKSIHRVDDVYAALQLSDQADFSLDANKKQMKAYIENAKKVSDSLEALGKHLVFYITPSKSNQERDEIPLRYQLKKHDGTVNGRDLLINLLQENNIDHIDSMDVLRNVNEFPIFYKTGVHWSYAAEQRMSNVLLDKIQTIVGIPLGQIKLKELKTQETPVWRDADTYNLLNLIWGVTDDQYYYYETEAEENNGKAVSILMQGGSFCEGFLSDIVRANVLNGGDAYFLSYGDRIFKNYNYGAYDEIMPVEGDFERIDIESLIEKINIIIIEVNEGSGISRYSDGFVDYLAQYFTGKN